jgi:hypothetical protein
MPELNIRAFRARTMIMGRFGPHSALSAHDLDTARCEAASLKFQALGFKALRSGARGGADPGPGQSRR